MTQQTTAYTNQGVQYIADLCKIEQENNIAIKGAKAVTRAVAGIVLTIAGLVESTAFAILAFIALPTKISKLFSTDHSAEAWNNAKRGAQATLYAFKGITGYTSKTEAPAAPVVESPAAEEPAVDAAPAADADTAPAQPSAKSPNFIMDNKGKIAACTAATIAVGLVATYLGIPQAIVNYDYVKAYYSGAGIW